MMEKHLQRSHLVLFRVAVLLVLFALLAVPLPGQSKDGAKAAPAEDARKPTPEVPPGPLLRTSWPATPDANGYVVEIRDATGRVLLTERTKENSVSFRLSPGAYQYRVAVLNKFRRPGTWSDWAALVVRLSMPPELTSVRPQQISIPPAQPPGAPSSPPVPRPKRLTLRGAHLLPDTTVLIQSETGSVAVERTEYVNADELLVFVSAAELRQGKLTVRVQNPGGKRGSGQGFVTVVVGGPRDDVAMIQPMRQDPARTMDPKRRADLARAERRAMTKRALIPMLGPIERKNAAEIGIWATLYGSYLIGGVSEWRKGNALAAEAGAAPLAFFSNPFLVVAGGSAVASGTANSSLLLGGVLLSQQRLTALKREHRASQHRQLAIGGLAAGTYLVQVYGESFRGFDPAKLVPGLPQFKMGDWKEGALWSGGFAALALGSYYGYREANSAAAQISKEPLIGLLSNPVTAGMLLAGTGGSDTPAFLVMVGLSYAARSSAQSRFDTNVRLQYGLGVGAAVVVVAYLLNVPPAAQGGGGQPGRNSSGGQRGAFSGGALAGFPLLYYGPDDRGGKTTQVGWMLVF